MAGEMSQSEVTRDAYPGLFALRDALRRRGIASEPRAFDQYQGPYLAVRGAYPRGREPYGVLTHSQGTVRVWYSGDPTFWRGAGPVSAWSGDHDANGRKLRRVDSFVIEHGYAHETSGAGKVIPATDTAYEHGVYTLRQAARRIAEIAR